MAIDWSNLFKVRVSTNLDVSMHKHDVVKLLLVRKLLFAHKKDKMYVRIYTEFPLNINRICDIYFENVRSKEAYAFEIQKQTGELWTNKAKEDYKNWDVLGCNTCDLIVVKLDELSNNIDELNKQLDKFVL